MIGQTISHYRITEKVARGLVWLLVVLLPKAQAVEPGAVMHTLLGSDVVRDGGPATSAFVASPFGLVFDARGNLFVSDTYNHRIRQITTERVIETVAGLGVRGFSGDGGPALSALMSPPFGIAIDRDGAIYFSDFNNHRVRKFTPGGIIATVAGNGEPGVGGDGGLATDARLNAPTGLAFDNAGNLFIGDNRNNRIRRVATDGVITTAVGTGVEGFSGDGGLAAEAQIARPWGVTFNDANHLYIADTSNHRIRRISTDGVITTVAGTGVSGFSGDGGLAIDAQLSEPRDVLISADGNVYIADTFNQRVRRVDPSGTISTVAGTGERGFGGDGGPALQAKLSLPSALALDLAGILYISDSTNHRIRRVSPEGTIETIAGLNHLGEVEGAPEILLFFPGAIALDESGNVYTADTFNRRVFKRNLDGLITRFAGTGRGGFSGDGGPAEEAQLGFPWGLAVGPDRSVYIGDATGARVRRVSADGLIETVAGNGVEGFSGDGGLATLAQLRQPRGVAVDDQGVLYIADWLDHRIRMVAPTGVIHTLAGTGTEGFSGDGGPASQAEFAFPNAVAVAQDGTVYVADTANHRIREISTDGMITTFAGDGTDGFGGDHGPAVEAHLSEPWGLALDELGSVYIADFGNHRIRKVDSDGIITTVVGTGEPGFSGDGGGPLAARLGSPQGIAVDGHGDFFVADTDNHRLRHVTSGPIVLSEAIFNAASFRNGELASDSVGTLFGYNLMTEIPAAGLANQPPTSKGPTLQVIDSLQTERTATLSYASGNQLNFWLPSGLADGEARLQLWRTDGRKTVVQFEIATVHPGLFSANADGAGVAAAMTKRSGPTGGEIYEPTFEWDPITQQFDFRPILIRPQSDTILWLYGTGIRGFESLSELKVTTAGKDVQLVEFEALSQPAGVDRVAVRLPTDLRGVGEVDVTVANQGKVSNAVRLLFE